MNLCYDHLRRRQRFRPQPLESLELLPAADDPAAEVESSDLQATRRAALAWVLDQLPSEERLLLHFRLGEGRSYAAIAALLGLNPVTVGTRLYRARARLQRLVAEQLGATDGMR
jgi:RNA polymerase sigma-70 factor, ECF subfamily